MQQNKLEQFNTSVSKILSNDVEFREKLDELHELQDLSETLTTLNDNSLQNFWKCVILCLSSPSNTLKATTIRTIRFYCRDSTFITEMTRNNVTYFIATCLEKNKGTEVERIQVIKLIRTIKEVNVNLMPCNLVLTLISIAKQLDDPLYFISLDLLNEIAIYNPQIIAANGGFSTLISNIVDHSPFNEHFQESLTVTILYLLDDIRTRQYIRPSEILTVLSPLIDTHEVPENRVSRWNAAKSGIMKILKSWTGLITFTSDPLAIKKLVCALQLQNLDLNDIILDLLFGIFHLSIPKYSNDKENSIFSANYNKYEGSDDRNKEFPRITQTRHNLLDNYQAALLLAFNDAELLENLLKFCERINALEDNKTKETRTTLAIKATCLVGELLNLSNHLLPPSQCARLQMLSPLVESAITFTQDPRLRSLAGTIVSNLHAYSHIKVTHAGHKDSRVEYISDIKKKLDWKMDDSILRQKMNDSVLLKKDSTQWNWEVIQELIEGPLANPQHFNSPLTSKYLKKIFTFYIPSGQLYAFLPCIRTNERYSKIGSQLLKLILSHDNGKQILIESNLISELHDLLKEEYQKAEAGKKDKDSILNEEKVLKNMSRDYFLFIGILSSNEQGIELLSKYKLFDQLVNIVQQSKRDDLCTLIIKNVEYNWNSPTRRILSKALSHGSTIVKFLALKQVNTLLRTGIVDYYDWGIKLIVKQLDEGQERIFREALQILNEVSNNPSCLDAIIARKPLESLIKMGVKGKDLLLRFLSRSSGFKYLSTTPFVNQELSKWRDIEYINYVMTVESSLNDAFCSSVWKDKTGNNDIMVNLPPHLYGELAHTPDGCRLIQENGHFEAFVNIIQSPSTSNLEKRGALWALGNIGRSRHGYKELFTKHDVLRLIIHSAKNSHCLSIKGTCFYVLGLLSKAKCVSKALELLGWESQRETSITVPVNLTDSGLFSIPSWNVKVIAPNLTPQFIYFQYKEDEPKFAVLKSVWDLSNHITTEKALNNLKRLKSQQPALFTDHELYFRCLRIMGNIDFQIRVRRFVHQIFSVIWTADQINKLEKSELFTIPDDLTPISIPKFVPKRYRSQSSNVRKNSIDESTDSDSSENDGDSPSHHLKLSFSNNNLSQSMKVVSKTERSPSMSNSSNPLWSRDEIPTRNSTIRPRGNLLVGSRNNIKSSPPQSINPNNLNCSEEREITEKQVKIVPPKPPPRNISSSNVPPPPPPRRVVPQ